MRLCGKSFRQRVSGLLFMLQISKQLWLWVTSGAALSVLCVMVWFGSQPLSRSPSNDVHKEALQEAHSPHPYGFGYPQAEGGRQKFLIYSCDGRHSVCGGWADRQIGIASTFLLAHVTGRRFGVNMTFPCDLQHFYQPNQYDWVVRDEDIGKKTVRKIKSIDGNSKLFRELSVMDFNARYPEDVVILQTNNELHRRIVLNPLYQRRLPLWARRPASGFFHDAWHMLMKPSARLEGRLASLLARTLYFQRTRPLVGVHVRIGNSATLRDSLVRNDVTKMSVVWDFVADYVRKNSTFFLATDNQVVRQMSRERFGSAHYDARGLIVHVDKHNNASVACPGLGDALLEQLMLTRCDVIVMSRSGFSERAVMMKGSYRNTFMFKNGGIKPFNLSDDVFY